jgi:hypothetical protein
MKKNNRILAGVLALQFVLIAVVFWPRPAASGEENGPLLGEIEPGDIVSLIIEDVDGNHLALQRTTGKWVLPEAGDYPSRDNLVPEMLEKLITLTTGRLVTRTDGSHKRLQVASDDYLRRIELETADGQNQVLYLGSSPTYGATHIRLEGQDETYLTDDLSVWDANATATSWIDTNYLQVPQEEITSLTLRNANGEWTFEKDDQDDEGNWLLVGLAEDETLNTTAVDSLVRQASSVTMLRPLGKDSETVYGLDQPLALVTLQTGEKTITLHVGAADPDDNSHVIKASDSPYYVRISEYSANNLVDKTRDDFLTLPPTPTAEPGDESDGS